MKLKQQLSSHADFLLGRKGVLLWKIFRNSDKQCPSTAPCAALGEKLKLAIHNKRGGMLSKPVLLHPTMQLPHW